MSARAAATAARKPRRAAEPPPTREVILDTAERLFAVRGVNGVALRDLAREMGLTAPSLYNHFPSKQALYDAVLERGLRPIFETLAEAWHSGALRVDHMHATTDKLIDHLAAHPHLARLLQRALLEESGAFSSLIAHWLTPIYRQGLAVVRDTAQAAGWEPAHVPFLGIALFGMIFAYFTDFAGLQAIAGWPGDPLAPRTLALQREVLQEALTRLLAPHDHAAHAKHKT